MTSVREKLEQNYLGEPNSGCWLWMGAYFSTGYGAVRDEEIGNNLGAHRAAYREWVGPIPDGMMVCHKCDTPGCIRPDHLFLGTPGDNARDMIKKNRHRVAVVGQPSNSAKITAESAAKIFCDTRSANDIAASYGIHRITVSDIKRGKAWSFVTGKVYEPNKPKLSCKFGHPWVPENIYESNGKRKYRYCKACARERDLARRRKN